MERASPQTNGARTFAGTIERLGLPDEDRYRPRLCNQKDEGSHPAVYAIVRSTKGWTMDDEFLKNCEWRDNLFPELNWKYYV